MMLVSHRRAAFFSLSPTQPGFTPVAHP
jgi:hypothetical protein